MVGPAKRTAEGAKMGEEATGSDDDGSARQGAAVHVQLLRVVQRNERRQRRVAQPSQQLAAHRKHQHSHVKEDKVLGGVQHGGHNAPSPVVDRAGRQQVGVCKLHEPDVEEVLEDGCAGDGVQQQREDASRLDDSLKPRPLQQRRPLAAAAAAIRPADTRTSSSPTAPIGDDRGPRRQIRVWRSGHLGTRAQRASVLGCLGRWDAADYKRCTYRCTLLICSMLSILRSARAIFR